MNPDEEVAGPWELICIYMKKSGVDTSKVGIGGTKEDVCCFIAGLIQYQIMYNINIEYMVNDTSEYDPDDNPEDYEDELG